MSFPPKRYLARKIRRCLPGRFNVVSRRSRVLAERRFSAASSGQIVVGALM